MTNTSIVHIPTLTYTYTRNSRHNPLSPRYQHDCRKCLLRGHLKFEEHDADIYTCGETNVVARRSDDGPDYISFSHDLEIFLQPATDLETDEPIWTLIHATVHALMFTQVLSFHARID